MHHNHDHTRPPLLSGEPFKADPYPTYAWLRENAPVFCRTSADGQARLWLLTRYDDVAAALRDQQRFVKDVANTMTPAERAAQPEPPPLYRLLTHHMLNADGADHARLRGLVNRAFSARRVEEMEPLLFTSAHRLIDRALRRGQMDLIADFSLPFAVEAIAAMLGVGAADHGRLRAWSHVLVAPSASSERNERKTARLRAAMEDFVAYLDAARAARRRLPQPDLISALLAAEAAGAETGDALSPEEFYSMILLLIVVGHETSVYLVGNLVLTLLLQPGLWQWLRATPAQIPAAVEELIRFDGPVERATMRFAAEEIELRGQTLRRGDAVSLVLAAAHRDPAAFTAPDQIDVARADNRHLGFGLGAHYCLGAPLARLEARVALTVLFERLPHLRLAVDPSALRWHTNPILRAPKRLPVTW